MSKTPTSQITKVIKPANVLAVSVPATVASINKATFIVVPCLYDGVGDQAEQILVQGV